MSPTDATAQLAAILATFGPCDAIELLGKAMSHAAAHTQDATDKHYLTIGAGMLEETAQNLASC